MSKKKTTNEFINEARKVHGDKYDYSKVEYIDANTKVCIICPKHGEFWQKPISHIRGNGCPICNPKKKVSENELISRFVTVHGDKYNYSKIKYKNMGSKICIVCPEHGEFWQDPHTHLKGSGCPKCHFKKLGDERKIGNKDFIERAIKIHGNKYDYSKAEYKGCFEKVCIICPKHGEFWQIANSHLRGQGCPKCNNSLLENKVMSLLVKNNIRFYYQYYPKFLSDGKSHLSLDFYLPDYNIAIECQGMQHYRPVKTFGGEEQFKKQIELDKKKKMLCEKNDMRLLYYSTYVYKDKNAISSLKKLLNEIRKF